MTMTLFASARDTCAVIIYMKYFIIGCFLLNTCVHLSGAGGGGFQGGFYADNNVDQSVIYQHVSKRERRELQQEILSILGLHHRPRPHDRDVDNSAPKFMIDLYRSMTVKSEDDVTLVVNETQLLETPLLEDEVTNVKNINDADVIMSFVNHAHGHSHIRHDKDRRFWFDVSEVPAGESILTSELRVYKDIKFAKKHKNTDHDGCAPQGECGQGVETSEEKEYTMDVYQLVTGQNPEDKELLLSDSMAVTSSTEGWLKFNVTKAVEDWIAFPEQNFGLYMRLHEKGHSREVLPREIGLVGVKGLDEQKPFMVSFFKTPGETRVRHARAVRKRQRTDVSYRDDDNPWSPHHRHYDERHSRRNCQKRTLYVSFDELGWKDWIIAPDGYAAFYCFGECSFPLNAHMNATNHAIVQTLVHLMYPYKVPKPCCAPSKLTAISVLYFDDTSNVILKKYRNMVVKSCGCH